ncbi:hypothetical protein [Parasphingorhabdus sp.]|uniref:hypothetical protein n=1 Tax=Parasphingorhabdus sp. TaxID=2709688 RepID=UPI002F92F498
MAKGKKALAREFVDYWLEYLDGDFSYTPSANLEMVQSKIFLPDLLWVLENGQIVYSTKENPHDSQYKIVGNTLDDDPLEIILSIEPIGRGLCIDRVAWLLEQDNEEETN